MKKKIQQKHFEYIENIENITADEVKKEKPLNIITCRSSFLLNLLNLNYYPSVSVPHEGRVVHEERLVKAPAIETLSYLTYLPLPLSIS